MKICLLLIVLLLLHCNLFFYSPICGCPLHFETSSTRATEDIFFNVTAPELLIPTNPDDLVDLSVNATSDDEDAVCDPARSSSQCKVDLLEVCRSVDGVNRCTCPENLDRNEEGKCSLSNECADESFNNCSSYALCSDLPEGYTCRCKAGFKDTSSNHQTLPGRNCVLLDWKPQESPNPYGQPSTNPNESVPLTGDGNDTNDILADAPILNGLTIQNVTNDQVQSISSLVSTLTTPFTSSSQQPDVPDDNEEPLRALSSGKLKDIFILFDGDGNQLVSLVELKNTVEKNQLQLNDDELQAMIKVADSNGDGMVNLEEFLSLMKSAS